MSEEQAFVAFNLFARAGEGKGPLIGTIYETPRGFLFLNWSNRRKRSRNFRPTFAAAIPTPYSAYNVESVRVEMSQNDIVRQVFRHFNIRF